MRKIAITALIGLASLTPALAQEQASGFDVAPLPRMTALPEVERTDTLDASALEGLRFQAMPFMLLPRMTAAQVEAIREQLIGQRFGGVEVADAKVFPDLGGALFTDQPCLDVIDYDENGIRAVTCDDKGNPTLNGTLGWISPSGQGQFLFEETLDEQIRKGIVPRFAIILDMSGSMFGEINGVKSSALEFMAAFPNALCKVSWYSDKVITINDGQGENGYLPCGGQWDFSAIEANGGTVPGGVILSRLQELSQPRSNAVAGDPNIAACIIISDGRDLKQSDVDQFKAYKGVPCFIYYLGDDLDKALYGQFVVDAIDVNDEPDVAAAFKRFANKYIYSRYLTKTNPEIAVANE